MKRRVRQICGLTVLAFLLSCEPFIAYGQDKNGLLTAEHMFYEKQGEVLRAEGSAHYQGDDYDLTASALRYDMGKDILYAEGNIKLAVINIGKEKKTGMITAEKLTFFKKDRRFIVERNVMLKSKGNELTCGFLEYKEKEGIFTAWEKIFLKEDGGNSVAGESLRYDINSDVSEVENFIYNFNLEGLVYYGTGRRLIQSSDKVVTEDGVLSTCNLLSPDYHFSFKRSEYFSGDKLVLYKAAYWEKDRKIYERDKVVISIQDETTAGYSQDEGWYMKTKQRYNLGGKNYGVIYRDYMSIKGLGLGAREYYYFPDNSRKEYFIYGAGYIGRSNATLQGEYGFYSPGENNLMSIRYDDFRWQSAGEQYQGTLSTANSVGKRQENFQLYYNKQLNSWLGQKISNDSVSVQLSEDVRISEHLRGTFNGSAYRTKNSEGLESNDRTYAFTLDYSDRNYFAQVYNYEAKYGLDYAPKISLTSNFNTPVQFELATTRVSRNYSNFSMQQSDLKANYVSQPVKILGNNFFSYNVNAARSTFSNGYFSQNWLASPSLQTNFTPDFYVNTRYSIQRNKGYNPITMYAGQDTQTIDWNANWRIDENFNTTVSTRYDIDNKLYSPLSVSIQGKTYPFWSWNLTTAFDLNQGYTDSVGLYAVLNRQIGFTGYVGFNYSPHTHSLRDLTGRLQFAVDKKWNIDTQFYYDISNKTMNTSEVKIVRTFHCREIQVFMYPREKQYYAYYVLKNP